MTADSSIPDATNSITDAVAVITDARNRAPEPQKRIGRNGKARKTTPAFAAVTKRTGATSTIDAWAAKITAAWCKTVAAIFETGDLLNRAKQKIDHGEWCLMFETKLVPFDIRTAQRLMEIANTKWLRKTATWPFLPPYYRALYELTKFDDEMLTEALDLGLIHPEMTVADVTRACGASPPILSGLPIVPHRENFGRDSDQIFLEWMEAYYPTVPKINLFRRTGPRNKWQRWGVEISECPGTRTVNFKVFGEYWIIRLPARVRAPATLGMDHNIANLSEELDPNCVEKFARLNLETDEIQRLYSDEATEAECAEQAAAWREIGRRYFREAAALEEWRRVRRT